MRKSHFLLLDTNFILDGTLFENELADLLEELDKFGCQLLTIQSVLLETLAGTKNELDLSSKITYLEMLFKRPYWQIRPLPIDNDMPSNSDILNFSRQCHKFARTDFELYLALKKYRRSNLMLITRNHTDFTNKLFTRHGFITLLGAKEIRTYGLYAVN